MVPKIKPHEKCLGHTGLVYAAIQCLRYSKVLEEQLSQNIAELEIYKPYLLGVRRGTDPSFSEGYKNGVKLLNSNSSYIKHMVAENCEEVKRVLAQRGELSQGTKLETTRAGFSETIHPPSLAQRVGSFSKSMANWAKKGFKIVTPGQFAERLNLCHSCPQWEAKAMAGTGRCKVCGCSTEAKLRLATEKCPLDKWGPVSDPQHSYEQPNTAK